METSQKSAIEKILRKSTLVTILQLWDATQNGTGDIFHFLLGVACERIDTGGDIELIALDEELEFLLNILKWRNL